MSNESFRGLMLACLVLKRKNFNTNKFKSGKEFVNNNNVGSNHNPIFGR